MGKREKPAVSSAWLWTTAADNGVGGVTKKGSTMCSSLRTSKRRELVSKARALLRRPSTFKAASFVLNVINLVVRVIDHFK